MSETTMLTLGAVTNPVGWRRPRVRAGHLLHIYAYASSPARPQQTKVASHQRGVWVRAKPSCAGKDLASRVWDSTGPQRARRTDAS